MKFPNSFTIQPNSQLILMSEFLISPGVKITVSSTATLELWGAHLYGCLDMWQGIEVLDGGMVKSVSAGGHENLIEDAEMAIDVSNYTPNATNNILDLSDITFNKNYLGINLSNYTITSNTYSTPLKLSNCLFTCRNFTFNSASWPSATNLRSITSSTSGLGAPHNLQNAPVATLKNPRLLEPSHVAINLQNAGTTASLLPMYSTFSYNTIYVGPVSGGSSSNFLLFDSHETFISANASNVRVENCVFQNTRTLTINNTVKASAAIQFTSGIENMILEVNGTNSSLGCRFWDCHTAIEVLDAYCFKINNAIIRSTHSSSAPTNTTSPLPGDRGVYINTNRYEDYVIQNNEFTNVTDAVSMVCAPRQFAGGAGWFEPFVVGSTVYYYTVMYARDVSITNNTFCPELNTAFTGTTSNYMNNAITIGGPVNIWSTWSASGIKTENNKIYRVFKGISINGMNSIGMGYHADGPPKMVRTNTITLNEDNIWTSNQTGIDFVNSIPAPSGFPTYTSQTLQSIESNNLDVYNAPLTNTNISMIHCFGNGGVSPTGTVVPAPYVICNDVSDANAGFLFEGPNPLIYWRGNDMTNLGMGMALTNSAVIGTQGTTTAASDNRWLGSTWSGTNNGTFVDASSTATSSILYIQSTGNFPPPNNGGFAAPTDRYSVAGNTIYAAGSYSCNVNQYNQIMAPLPNYSEFESDNLLYVSKMQSYRYLYYAPALLGGQGTDSWIFFNDLAGSSIDIFTQVEDTLSRGNFEVAADLLASLDQSGFNYVETNYYSFYDLYLKYMDPADPDFSPDDLLELTLLAGLCPGTNGLPVYQARALYLMITGRVFNVPSDCGERAGARAGSGQSQNNALSQIVWDVELFPNPNFGNFAVISKSEKEILELVITDISGRQVFNKKVQTAKYVYVLDLPLTNGTYFITIKNQAHEQVTKKMVVAK
jgi:hypothetical protein